MKFRFKLSAVVVLALVTLNGCYPGSGRTLENTEIVFTTYDEDYNFSDEKTYFLVDDVLSIDTSKTIPNQTQSAILDKIVEEMDANGWEQITDTMDDGMPSTDAAIIVLASGLTGTIEGVSYYGGGYGGWWGGYWGYPGYGYGYAIPYSYDIGTIYIDMIDYSTYDPTDDKSIQLVWTSAMNGVLSSTGFDTNNRIEKVIDQAFEQSPYL